MPRRDDCDEPEYLRKLFIGNLSFNTTDDTLRDFFSEFGTIVDCVVMKNKETGKSRGFGFVTYSESTMVDGVQSKRPHKVDGREVDTKRVVPKEEANKPESKMQVKKVFVGGIKNDMTEEDLQEAFERFGTIKSASIPKDKATNKPRTFAFVDFEDSDSVDKVCLFKDDIKVAGRHVNVRKAVDKEQMRNQEQRGGGGGNRGGGDFGNNSRGNNFGGGGGGGGYGGNQQPWQNNQQSGGNYGGQGGYGGNQGGYNGNQGGGNYNQGQGGYNGMSGGGGGNYNGQGGNYSNQSGSPWGGNQGQSSGGWGGNQGQSGGSWGGNQGQSSGTWGGNQPAQGGGGSWGGNQSQGGGGSWGGNQGGNNYGNGGNQGPMRGTSNYSNNRSAPYNTGGGGGGGYARNF